MVPSRWVEVLALRLSVYHRKSFAMPEIHYVTFPVEDPFILARNFTIFLDFFRFHALP